MAARTKQATATVLSTGSRLGTWDQTEVATANFQWVR